MYRLNLLVIADSEEDTARVTTALAEAGYDVRATRVDSPAALTAALESGEWDIVISDYLLRAFTGAAALTMIREHGNEVPFIYVSGAAGAETAVAAMRTGAQDYLVKNNLARLAPAVERELAAAAVRRERRLESDRVAYLAYHDELTELPNRTLLHDRLRQGILAARRDRRSLALLILDLDGFKEINDTLGHHAGDRVLQVVAARLRTTLRESDTVARLGGDEFALLLLNTDAAGAELAAAKVLQEIEVPLVLEQRPLLVHGSIGIASFPEQGTTEQNLLQKADLAMYVAKNDRSGFAVYSPDRDGRTEHRSALVSAMSQGIDRGQFRLDYQPIVSLQNGAVAALEGLIRWDHPQLGRLSPRQFIQLAEHNGLITRLTEYAIRTALAEWPCDRHHFSVAVNLSPRSLHDTSFPGMVADVLARLDVDASCLALEITENVVMSDPERSIRCLNALHDMGIRLVMDDFGTGYSSLAYLRRLPVSQLKIDKSFVIGLAGGEDDTLVRSIIDLAHNLGLQVVAEGVETALVWDRLRALGCDLAQGHYLSLPAPAPVIAQWIKGRAVSV